MTRVEVVDDPAAAAAERILAVAGRGGSLVLAGGSTPKRAYELANTGDFSRATLLFGDERCVPPDDERSNFGMVRESLLVALSAPPAHLHRMEGELGHEAAAQAYEAIVREAGEPDLLLLGVGPDGHTASLFPGKPEIDVEDRLVVGVPEAGLEPFVPRVSLTLPALARARETLFLVSGKGKAETVRRAFGPDPEPLPSARVAAAGANVTVLLDPAAAEELG
jgi:6-phosphogluconolactonase